MSDFNAFLNKLNSIGLIDKKPYLKISEMILNQPYDVKKLYTQKTQFQNRAILAELENHIAFLPKRFETVLSDLDIVQLNSRKVAIVYRGVKIISDEYSIPMVEFIVT